MTAVTPGACVTGAADPDPAIILATMAALTSGPRISSDRRRGPVRFNHEDITCAPPGNQEHQHRDALAERTDKYLQEKRHHGERPLKKWHCIVPAANLTVSTSE